MLTVIDGSRRRWPNGARGGVGPQATAAWTSAAKCDDGRVWGSHDGKRLHRGLFHQCVVLAMAPAIHG